MKEVVKRFSEVIADRNDLLLHLNDYKVFKEDFGTQTIGKRRYFESDNSVGEAIGKELGETAREDL